MAQEEDVFMRMLDSLDPSARIKQSSTADVGRASNNDLSTLLDGAENWDWTDMEADFMTPKKKKVGRLVRHPRLV